MWHSIYMPVQRLKVAVLPLDLRCSGPLTHSGDISIADKSHKRKLDISSKDDMEMDKVLINIQSERDAF
jgi:hypothetical protein